MMRVFMDHTVGPAQGPYNPSAERHLVVSFFENFAIDTQHRWVRSLGERLGMVRGEISNACWSYEYEEKLATSRRNGGPGIADVVVSWRDEAGEAVIVFEAKRPGGVGKTGLAPEDDPRNGAYLQYARIRPIDRRQQMLLLAARDIHDLPNELRGDARVLAWEELAQMQLECTAEYAGSRCPELMDALLEHYATLGIQANIGDVPTPRESEASATAFTWLEHYRSFVENRRRVIPLPPIEWMAEEPDSVAFRSQRKQSTQQREEPLWRCRPG
jgi:hypothetical protein